MNEIVLNKKISIERCVQQIQVYYALDNGQPFATDYLKQDAIGMNLQRACELSLDIENHLQDLLDFANSALEAAD